jgi:hypothetical protein
MGSHIYAQAGHDHHLPIYAFHITGMIDGHHHAQLLLIEMKSPEDFAWVSLEP